MLLDLKDSMALHEKLLTIKDEVFTSELSKMRSVAYRTELPIEDSWENQSVQIIALYNGNLVGGMRLVPLSVGSNQLLTENGYHPKEKTGFAIERAWVNLPRPKVGLAPLYRFLICEGIRISLLCKHSYIACLASALSTRQASEAGFIQDKSVIWESRVSNSKIVKVWSAEWNISGYGAYNSLSNECLEKFKSNGIEISVSYSDCVFRTLE